MWGGDIGGLDIVTGGTDNHLFLLDLIGRRLVALTGAGCSTESGIPDYRGPTAPPRKRPPIQHRDFMEGLLAAEGVPPLPPGRRALAGTAKPNDEALARLEAYKSRDTKLDEAMRTYTKTVARAEMYKVEGIGQDHLPGQYESRNPDADEWHHRHD